MEPTVPTIAGDFTEARFKKLQEAYCEAVQENKNTFDFEGQEVVTLFAKYLLEYLGLMFNNK